MRTLFIYDLNPVTSAETLAEFFRQRGFNIPDSFIVLSKNPREAFARFGTKEEAARALRTLSGSVVDGESIHMKSSFRELRVGHEAQNETPSDAITLHRIPDDVSVEEICGLFGSIGVALKPVQVRIPINTKGPRAGWPLGLAFICFGTVENAKKVYVALKANPPELRGRVLPFDYAYPRKRKTEESVHDSKVTQELAALWGA